MAYNTGAYVKVGTSFHRVNYPSHWNLIDGMPTNFPPTAHNHDASNINAGTLHVDRIPTLAISKVTDLQTTLNGKITYNDVMMPTNPFGGKKIYINSIDNAFYAADKRFVVTGTRHLVSYNGETYPKLNPDYVALYTITGTGTTRTITNSPVPSNIVVYEVVNGNDNLKNNPTHYSYDSGTGVITFTYTPSGTIYVYPDYQIQQYLDSPVVDSVSAGTLANLFDGSYESQISVANGYYLKIKITPNTNCHVGFNGYPYGSYYLSYYYTGTPDKAEYRVYNYSYRPHIPGWKKFDMTDYIGVKTAASYIQTISDENNYGRTIVEFIIYGHDTSGGAVTTNITQIDYKLSRPNLSNDGSTVTKYGVNKLYYQLKLGTAANDNVVIDPSGSITLGGVAVVKTNDSRLLRTINSPEALTTGADLNTFTLPGYYATSAGAICISLVNRPIDAGECSLKVELMNSGLSTNYLKQTFSANVGGVLRLFERYRSTIWLSWKEVAFDIYSWAKASTKPSYDLSEIAETTTYKRVTQTEKDTWNGKLSTNGTAYDSTRWNNKQARYGSYSSGASGYITFSYS